MTDFLIKSSISLFALLFFYHLVLEREKMHKFNRFYLLFSLVFSFVIPFITIEVIDESAKKLVQTNTVITDNATIITVSETVDYSQIILWSIYCLITGLLLVRFIKNILKITSKIKSNDSVNYKNAKLILLKEKTLPHTFWDNIFINETDYNNRKIEDELYTHELIHVTQKHTLDILLVETLKTVFWFNPLFIFYKKAIQLNHEFLADEQVVNSYNNVPFYQNLLLSKANENQPFYLASNLNYSVTKKRLIMMTKKTPMSIAILKKIAILPLFLSLISLICIEGVAKEKEITASTTNENTKTNTKKPNVAIAFSYSYIGKSKNQPTFKDDLEELFRYMGTNYKTPNEISKSGKIVVTFMIEKDGSLSDLKAIKDIGLGTGAEAVHILKSCPKLRPAIVNGEAVRAPIALQIEVMVLDKKIKTTDTPNENIKAINIISDKKDKTQPVGIKTEKIQENEIHNTAAVSEKPNFPGGIEKFYKFVGENYKAPKEPNLKGKVYITFIIEKNGNLSNMKIIKDIGFGSGDEAIRVLKLSPKWIPGKIDGNPVRVLYSLPITIQTAN